TDCSIDVISDAVLLLEALLLNESLVDANALSASLVVLPFDTLWLNESTADTNSLTSVLTASLCEVEALVEVDVLIDVDLLNDACV
ncbi:hypothetical protein B4W69_14165, partial [Staphylococcus delphini]